MHKREKNTKKKKQQKKLTDMGCQSRMKLVPSPSAKHLRKGKRKQYKVRIKGPKR